MYEDYFGLERPPFKITPDTSLFYEGGKRGDILEALVYSIHRGEGIIKVVGEVGSGKTMLCRMLQLKLPATIEIVYIANPSVSPEDILFVIAHELSLPVAKDASKHEVMQLLQDYLLQRHMENKQAVLFIEEAQSMPLATLEEIRLLSNLETDQNKLLQIILFGQPELDQNLSQQSIRQLRERITHNFNLAPLTRNEIHNYLNFRMREVGYTGPELINRTIAKKVEQHSAGLLRRINIIADKILLSAFSEGTHNLSPKHVTAAVNDSAFDRESSTKSRKFWWLGLIAVVLAALALGVYQTRSQWISVQSANTAVNQQNVVPNDKPVTDIEPQVRETAQSVMEKVQHNTAALPDLGKPAPTALNGFEKPVAADDQHTQTASKALQSAIEVKPPPVELRQPVEAVAQQAGAAVRPADAPARAEQKALDQTASIAVLASESATDLGLNTDYNQWLNTKLDQSLIWLSNADRDKVSIQVMMRSKSAARELVYYLRNDWPLDLSKTYLYEENTEERSVYRVFYSEFETLSQGRDQLEQFPESVKVNSPYLHSVNLMQKALL